MAKRFTDTNKYKKSFYRALPGAYKLFWDFLYHDCDHAGIWIIDFDIAQTYVGHDMLVSRETALELFNKDEVRIMELPGGKKWFIIPFIEFQYGRLSEKNKAHNSIISVLKKHDLIDDDLKLKEKSIPPSSPLQGAKEMDKEMEMEEEMDFGKSENLLAPKMVFIFKESYPDYPADKTTDFPACVQIAKKIATSKGWKKAELTNGKLEDTLNFWRDIVFFSKTDSWFSTRSISDFNKEYQRLIQKITNGNTAHKQPVAESKSGKPASTSDSKIDALNKWVKGG